MDTIKLEGTKAKMIAHRGLSCIERENTYPAFIAAANRSYYGIETDVHVAKDGNFVIIHDSTTERVSNGLININVEKCTYDQIKEIVLPDLDGSISRNDIRIPLLQDYINICKKYSKKCILEIKDRFNKKDIIRMVELIKTLDYLDNVIFISFVYENLVDLREILPNCNIQFLTDKEIDNKLIAKLKKYNFDLDIHFHRINNESLNLLHDNDIKVNVWTCDNKEKAETLSKLGVDFITSNILE